MSGDQTQTIVYAALAGLLGLALGVGLTVAHYKTRGLPECEEIQHAQPAEVAVSVKPERSHQRPRGGLPTGAIDEVAAALEDEIADMEQELDRLRMEAAMAKGQLSHYEGDPQPWPEDVHAGFQPAAFEDAAEQAVADLDDAELLEVDCAEFPCLAVFRSFDEGPEWHQGIHERMPDPEGYDGEVGKMVWASESSGAEGTARLLTLALMPEGHEDSGLHERTEFRAGTLTEDIADEVLSEQQGAE
jgi:hypothetical protein